MRSRPLSQVIQAFWSRVNVIEGEHACWEWTGALISTGYGSISYNAKTTLAHVFSYIIHNGILPDGMWVLHHCDNRKCIRPDHLFAGTRMDNTTDMILKRRNRRKINEEDVVVIRARRARGEYLHRIAEDYRITATNVMYIVSRHSWKHVP